ncbi:hypothetical protein Slala03_06190 [Streptomyces lavendulae subsp. lavendulae]|nr:hypothetical protein Slala03_06190 [Streptomyces lavendulae subsp. lavendulae]GLX35534.1 hypothetical protein Sros01_16070 [Streptomyces roseochromogenus]
MVGVGRGTREANVRTVRTGWTARTAAGALLAVAVLVGCGAGGGSPGPGGPSGGATAGATAGTPGASGLPAPSASPSRDPAAERLVTVTRTGGFAGRTVVLTVRGDGSWTRTSGTAQPGAGQLPPAGLEALRSALRAADLPRLPADARADPPVYDGFAYEFAYDGSTVSSDEGSLTPGLRKVLEALPGF